jgi:hypothetical protein
MVEGMNILSRTVKVNNMGDIRFISLDDYNNYAHKTTAKPAVTPTAPAVNPMPTLQMKNPQQNGPKK